MNSLKALQYCGFYKQTKKDNSDLSGILTTAEDTAHFYARLKTQSIQVQLILRYLF